MSASGDIHAAVPPSGGEHRNVFVLSGGASRGAVQVGMLEVLLDAGIVPHALVGTSVGALNAAFLAARPDHDRVRELRGKWLQLTTRDIFPGGTLTRVGHLVRQRPYLFSSAALARLIEDWRPADRLEDLPVPVRVVTTPLGGDGAVYHRHGDLAQLLLASAAVPAVFAPVDLPASCGHPGLHVDGGVADNVPVAGAADLAPTRVFVLDASVPARLPRGRTPIDVLVASLGVAIRVGATPDLGPSVSVHRMTTPDRGVRMTDFSMTREHVADGRVAAQRALEEVLRVEQAQLAQQARQAGRPAPAARRGVRLWDRRERAA
ncbi:patatin-like phospholipase family protein [Nocardioides aurantiacus]|uniref:patatin-like phospholipase family protein n=1 Tax=Nocardioides aurantiacus TaxID=86796 RepID=UPI00403FAB66